MMAKRGRPSLCNPDRTATIARLMRAGNYFDCACEFAGISERTGHRWLKRGREALEAAGDDLEAVPEEEKPYVEFWRATREARRTAEARNVAIIQDAAKSDWRAAAWWLEKALQQTWGEKRQKLEHSGPDGEAIAIDQRALQDEDRARAVVQVLMESGFFEEKRPQDGAQDAEDGDEPTCS